MFQATDSTRLSATLDATGVLHARFDRLNSIEYGATLAAHHKFGLGPTKPWMRLHATASRLDVKENNRDGYLWEGGVQFGKRFTERIDATIAYAYAGREGAGRGGGGWLVSGLCCVHQRSAQRVCQTGREEGRTPAPRLRSARVSCFARPWRRLSVAAVAGCPCQHQGARVEPECVALVSRCTAICVVIAARLDQSKSPATPGTA